MNRLRSAMALSALAFAPFGSHAQLPDSLQVRSWAGACANCHGTNGRSQPGMVALAGMKREAIVQKMLDFKSGRQPATVMHQLSKGYSDDEIAAIAGYFAAQVNGGGKP